MSGCFMLYQRKPHPWDVDCSPMINIHDRQWNGNNPCVSKLRSPQKCDTLQRKNYLLPTSSILYRSDLYHIDLRLNTKNVTKFSLLVSVCVTFLSILKQNIFQHHRVTHPAEALPADQSLVPGSWSCKQPRDERRLVFK